ncbi:MAG: CPBP family intramembrane glutamic endopeptidase [Phycisphaeraceae bacterium]
MDIPTLLMALVAFAAQLGVFVWVVVFAALNWRGFAQHWKVGLLLAGLFGLLSLPVVGFDAAYFDPATAMAADESLGPGGPNPIGEPIIMAIYLLTTVVGLVFAVAWMFVCYVVAASEWRKVRAGAMPMLAGGGDIRWGGIALGAILGTALAAATAVVFAWLGVGESLWIEQMRESYPGIDQAPRTVLAPVLFLFVGLAAVVEEVEFRGALLGSLLRMFGSRGAAALASMVLVSVLFGLMHLLNTDAPLVKFTQIFILGMMTAELVRRSSLEAAIACHLALNLVSVAALPFMEW